MRGWHSKTGRTKGGASQILSVLLALRNCQLQACRRNRLLRTERRSRQVPEADVAAPIQHVKAGQQRVGVEAEACDKKIRHRASSPPQEAEDVEGVCRWNRKVEGQQVCQH